MLKKQDPELVCPKCNKPFRSKQRFNSQFVIYKHNQKEGCVGMTGLIDFCVFRKPKLSKTI